MSSHSLDKQWTKERIAHNVGIICGQNLIVSLQHTLQRSVIEGLCLFYQPAQCLHPLIVGSEAADEAREAFVGSTFISGT